MDEDLKQLYRSYGNSDEVPPEMLELAAGLETVYEADAFADNAEAPEARHDDAAQVQPDAGEEDGGESR